MFKKILNKAAKELDGNSGGGQKKHGGKHGGSGNSGDHSGGRAAGGRGGGKHHGADAGAAAGAGAGVGGASGGAGAASTAGAGFQGTSGSAPSKTVIDIVGLSVSVYGLDQLTPPSAGGVPDICLVVHMHGRTGSAKKEDKLVRELYGNMMNGRQALSQQSRTRDLLLVCFDSRDHGDRCTNPDAQKSWKEGNSTHGVDMYGMIRGTAEDASFVMDMLPSYLFKNDERRITSYAVTGKSLGGHCAWQVLSRDPRVQVGAPMIGTPDFQKLLAHRAMKSNLPDAPPAVPGHLRALMQRVDPAMQPYREASQRNPFYGKKICATAGENDHLVRVSYSEEFWRNLVLGSPEQTRQWLHVFVQPNTGHEVTSESTWTGAARKRDTDLRQCWTALASG